MAMQPSKRVATSRLARRRIKVLFKVCLRKLRKVFERWFLANRFSPEFENEWLVPSGLATLMSEHEARCIERWDLLILPALGVICQNGTLHSSPPPERFDATEGIRLADFSKHSGAFECGFPAFHERLNTFSKIGGCSALGKAGDLSVHLLAQASIKGGMQERFGIAVGARRTCGKTSSEIRSFRLQRSTRHHFICQTEMHG